MQKETVLPEKHPENRTHQGPVSGLIYFKNTPTEKDWEKYSGDRTIGLADGNPGLIVPQSLPQLQELYIRQKEEKLAFFEFSKKSQPEHDQTLYEVKYRGNDNPGV